MQNNITIIIPIYNEEENIGLLIDEIFEKYFYINILVVDDFSIDNSVLIVNNRIKRY
jgi:glycosyltransferase involved in cell wall biosynthesis